MHHRVIVTVLALGLAAALTPLPAAGKNIPGGEWACPRLVPYEDPPPTVVWGPFPVPDLRGLDWGFYGMSYWGLKEQLHACYFWQNQLHRYRSADSTNPSLPDTIPMPTIPSPVSDSFQDLAYCRYDQSVWLHSSKYKAIYKLDAATGALKRQFPSPATRYPTGIAFNEREKRIYVSDRMLEGTWPCSLYVIDTLGFVEGRFGLNHLGYSYSGVRCLDFDYTNSNPSWPTLLMTYTFFSGSGQLDSTVLFELDRTDLHVINRFRLPNLAGQVNNVRGVAWDPRSGDYWIGIMQNPENNIYKLDGWHQPLTIDAGLMSLEGPRGPVDSATTVYPHVTVRNFGATDADVPVRMRIGSVYDETRNKTIPAGLEDTVMMPPWTPMVIGTYPVKCSTGLAGDMFAANDTWTEICQVVRAGRDVACYRLIAPVGPVDSGVTVVPACSVFNYGSLTVTYPVRMTIGSGYDETAQVTDHIPGSYLMVQFPQWVARPRGLAVVACSTQLAGDRIPENDRQVDSVAVRVVDVGCTRLLAPAGIVDSGATVVPACTVVNLGTEPATYTVRMKVGSLYNFTALVSGQPPGERRFLEFQPWTAHEVGNLAVSCSTELAGDMVGANNRLTGSVQVRENVDVGVTTIVAPTGTLDSGTAVVPLVRVRNWGTRPKLVPTWFWIHAAGGGAAKGVGPRPGPDQPDQVYEDSVWVSVAGNDSAFAVFDTWYANALGAFRLESFTTLAGDLNPGNDTAVGMVVVERPVHDVGAFEILAPKDTVDTGATIVPTALVRNFGNRPEAFPVRFQIGGFYTSDTSLSLGVGATDTVRFAAWHVSEPGTHLVRCSTMLAGDRNPGNDHVLDTIVVVAVGLEAGGSLPGAFELGLPRPNPFTGTAAVRFALPRGCRVELTVFNSTGALVRTLVAAEEPAGRRQVVWNGADDLGRQVARGVYYLRLAAGGFRAMTKLVRLR